MLAHWVARTGLVVQSRLDPLVHVEDSWTCRRAMDGLAQETWHWLWANMIILFEEHHLRRIRILN